jgi:ACS family pantothenate transporter-like MFS transporter
MYAMIAVSIAMAIWTALLVWMHVRTETRRERDEGITPSTLKEQEIGDAEQTHGKAS